MLVCGLVAASTPTSPTPFCVTSASVAMMICAGPSSVFMKKGRGSLNHTTSASLCIMLKPCSYTLCITCTLFQVVCVQWLLPHL